MFNPLCATYINNVLKELLMGEGVTLTPHTSYKDANNTAIFQAIFILWYILQKHI